MTDPLAAARAAFDDDDYDESLQILDDALKAVDARSEVALVVKLLGQRSRTFIACGLYDEALEDARRALSLDDEDVEALLRLGIACKKLGRHAEAIEALERATARAHSGTAMRAECAEWLKRARLARENAGTDDGGRMSDASPSTTATERYRRTWYQSETHVTLEVFAKGVSPDAVTVDLNDAGDALKLTIDALSDEDGCARTYDPYVLEIDLFAYVCADGGAVNVSPTKIEIRMRKRSPGQWRDIERRPSGGLSQSITAHHVSIAHNPTVSSSDKRTAKDWDALERALDEELKDEPDGDAALNDLFQKIYANADDDARRAMNKSFTESNGTVLSTDWTDVGARDVVPDP